MSKCYGYVRVSTAGQAEKGESLAAQEERLKGYAKSLGREIDRVFIERGVSGSQSLSARPQGRKLLETAGVGDVILAVKLDRVFRDTRDALAALEDLRAKGVSLYLLDLGGDVTGNGIAQLVFTIMAAVATWERSRIAERIAEGKARAKEQDRWLGGKPNWGTRIVRKGGKSYVEPDENKRPALELAERLFRAGGTVRGVQAALLAECGEKVSVAALHRFKTTLKS